MEVFLSNEGGLFSINNRRLWAMKTYANAMKEAGRPVGPMAVNLVREKKRFAEKFTTKVDGTSVEIRQKFIDPNVLHFFSFT